MNDCIGEFRYRRHLLVVRESGCVEIWRAEEMVARVYMPEGLLATMAEATRLVREEHNRDRK